MTIGQWEKPITFDTSTLGKYWTVTSTAEAARALMERWLVDTGEALEEARRTCLAAKIIAKVPLNVIRVVGRSIVNSF